MLRKKNFTQKKNFVSLQMFHFILFAIASPEEERLKKFAFCFMPVENESRMENIAGGMMK